MTDKQRKRDSSTNRYARIIERIFFSHYRAGAEQFIFSREEIVRVAKELGIKLPKNLGDVIYSFRYRTALPAIVREKAPPGKEWIIRPAGRAKYRFVSTAISTIIPSQNLAETKVPDATPGIIAMYALSDEQALLAKYDTTGSSTSLQGSRAIRFKAISAHRSRTSGRSKQMRYISGLISVGPIMSSRCRRKVRRIGSALCKSSKTLLCVQASFQISSAVRLLPSSRLRT